MTARVTAPIVMLVLVLGAIASLPAAAPLHAQDAAPAWSASIDDIRRTAALMPGRRPVSINMLTFAESRRTKNFSVKGAPAEPSVQARTAFQVVYGDGTVMVDAGMDLQVHRFFGRGVEEPYFPEVAREVERAVRAARMIVVTHEHGDHVAGVIRGADAADLARKTILTRTQVQTLIATPQMPEIALTAATAARYVVVDYDKYLPVAPGMVFVKSAGHTPGSQMVYIVLESGREYLLIGDATWHMDGVRQMVGKDAPWVTEDKAATLDQLRWLNGLSRTDPTLVIVASHDAEQHADLAGQNLLGTRFQ